MPDFLTARARIRRLNEISIGLVGSPAVAAVDLVDPLHHCPELAFQRAIAWLFVAYWEQGRVGIRFLADLSGRLGFLDKEDPRKHMEDVQALRTEVQHNLGYSDDRDLHLRRRAVAWRREACGTGSPATDDDWERCLCRLWADADTFLEALERAVRAVEADDSRSANTASWRALLDRNFAPAAFDKIISIAAKDMGFDAIDPTAVRKRHLDAWRKQLEILQVPFDFETEARRLVEAALLKDRIQRLPITSQEIIRQFGLEAGSHRVERILVRALASYLDDPCDGATLLARLREREREQAGRPIPVL